MFPNFLVKDFPKVEDLCTKKYFEANIVFKSENLMIITPSIFRLEKPFENCACNAKSNA